MAKSVGKKSGASKKSYKTSKKSKYAKSALNQKSLDSFRKVLLSALFIIAFYPPFFRGSYFEKELLPTAVFVFIVFIAFLIYKLKKEDGIFLNTPVEYASAAFTVVYTISLLSAISFRLAVVEWLKYCIYFAVFIMLTDLIGTYKSKISFLWVITASACGVSILGIDGAAGGLISQALNKLFRLLGAQYDLFFGTFTGGRIFSTLQYPNTLSAYLMAAYFISLALAISSSKLWVRILACAAGYIELVTFVFAISRGAYLMIPVAAIIFLVVLPKEGRIKGAVYMLVSLIATAVASLKLSEYISFEPEFKKEIWIWFFAGILLSAILTVVVSYIAGWLEKLSWKVYVAAILSICAVFAAGVVIALNSTGPLKLEHAAEEAETPVFVKKSITLEPGREYRLSYDVEAWSSEDKPDAYSIRVTNRSREDILFDREPAVGNHREKATSGTEKREITLKVPDNSMIMNIYFTNTYAGTGAVFYDAKVIDALTGETIKDLPLKYKYLPTDVVSRFEDIKATKSSIERLIFYKDGFEVFKEHWLLGAGGGAWSLLYFSKQSYMYWTTQAHNFIIQLGIESGILGVLIYVFLFISIAAMFLFGRKYSSQKSDTAGKVLQSALFTSMLALIMHSSMDFDFTYPSVFLMFWQFAALFNAGFKDYEIQEGVLSRFKKCSVNVKMLISIAIIATTLSSMFIMGESKAKAAVNAINSKNYDKALEYAKSSVSADPFSPSYKIQYVNWLVGRKDLTAMDKEEADKNIKIAVKQAWYDVKLLPYIQSYYFSTGNIEEGLKCIDRAAELRPLRAEEWQGAASAYFKAAIHNFSIKDEDKGKEYLDKAYEVVERAKDANRRNMNPFILTPETSCIIETVKYVKDNMDSGGSINVDSITFYNMPELDIDEDGIPDQWSKGLPGEIEVGYASGVMKASSLAAEKMLFIESRVLSLEPGKTYTIEAELANPKGIDAIPFILTGVSEKNEGLMQDNGIYTAEVKTPEDFKAGSNVLKLGISGEYVFKSIKVIRE